MVKILFVCHGNICRSPMAEFVMKHKVAEMFGPSGRSCAGPARTELASGKSCGLTAADFEIASAATSTEEIGNPVYPPARRLLNSKGIDCSGHAARQMTQRDYDYYDYIVLMDRNNLRNLRWNISAADYAYETSRDVTATSANIEHDRKKISLMMDWTNRPGDVADPWYTGNFDATWRDVNEGCDGLLDYILNSK
ncbi:protein-tyrosine phosphatase [Fibrobacter sp. UWR4]|uniref:low molecular weight protein-tyrosine-phosphatase n=1 Tax=Fibrobacter sp. UWR4 TaxID=1896218 RepID=UPI000D6C1F2B|nr:low molecular weight protein-tyrosine-phosphatase [Fibrobacter sp. UWR4]PWJ63330.1 protein-tyrosine phosphatase [Fibrobacter sp. UWR4]